MTALRQWTVDAFASSAFKGNPACVVEPLDAWREDGWMQALAQENNQAETAFLRRTGEPCRFDLRWFTPTVEVDLCGHATLASGHVLFDELGLDGEAAVFATRSGELKVARDGGGYRMDFPIDRPRRSEPVAGLAEALGAEPVEIWAGRFLVAVVRDEETVRALQPDLAAVMRVASAATGGRGNVAVTALADPGADYDVVSRFFAPGSGIPEDPATGSLHCLLAPLYADKLGRPRARFHQAYPGRGGELVCEVAGDRVLLGGGAFTTVESRLRL